MKTAAIQQKRGGDLRRGNGVVEESGATAEHGLQAFPNPIGEGQARCEIVIAGSIVLPFVTNTGCQRQVRGNLHLVLDEPGNLPLPEHQMSVAGLLHK